MRELEIKGQDTSLNKIYALDDKAYNANHNYIICDKEDSNIRCNGSRLEHTENILQYITFQKGPRDNKDSIRGVTERDLLEIVYDRLKSFQDSEFACDRNEKALIHVGSAIEQLVARQEERKIRGVLGKDEQ